MANYKIKGNERSNQTIIIDLVNEYLNHREYKIKKMAGEFSITNIDEKIHMFPDILLFSDDSETQVLQGWELKMPDTPITDQALFNDAKRKAETLGLDSFIIWNFTYGELFIRKGKSEDFELKKIWQNANILTRLDVDNYRNEWINTLKDIIDTINDYLSDTTIKTRSLLDCVSSNNMIALIANSNQKDVADSIKRSLSHDLRKKYEISYVFQSQNKLAFSNQNNFDAEIDLYAKNMIINFCNKILIANLLKEFYSPAREIKRINDCKNSKEGLLILNEISKKIDFFNVFSPIDFQDDLPSKCWDNLKELNKVLSESNFREIDQSILQKTLEHTLSLTQRWFAGQYVTPYVLARILARLTILNSKNIIIDPCCGTGTIPKAVLEMKNDNYSSNDETLPIETIWASDKYLFPLQMATIALVEPEIKKPIKVFQSNAFQLKIGQNYYFIDPSNGEKREFKLPFFDNVISNLPFIPFESDQESSFDSTSMHKIEEEIKRNTGLVFSQRSDYYTYLIFSLWNILKIGGRAGFITSNSWLATDSGKIFFKALQYYYQINQIHISGNGRWFKNSDVVTVIIILTKKPLGEPNMDSQISFFKWKKDISSLNESMLNNFILDVFNTKESEYFEKNVYSIREINILLNLGLSLNSLFNDIKWLEEFSKFLIPFHDIFSIKRGVRPGWDDMFIIKDSKVIDNEFLLPMVKNSKVIETYVFNKPDCFFFYCPVGYQDLISRQKEKTIKWINSFSAINNKKGIPLMKILGKSNNPWYFSRNKGNGFDFITPLNPNTRFFFSKIDKEIVINQRLVGLTNQSMFSNDILHCLLNSILNYFFVEATGIGRGDGVLDINARHLASLFLLNPGLLTKKNQEEILEKFNKIKNRRILSIDKELENPLRIEFEKCVLSAYGLEQYFENIKSSLLNMIASRLTATKKH